MRDFDVRSLGRRLRDGDSDAPKEILAAFGGDFVRCLRGKHKRVLPADDAAQVVLLAVERAWRYRSRFDPDKGELEPWLWRIVKREAARMIAPDAYQQRLHETCLPHHELAELALAPVQDDADGPVAADGERLREKRHKLVRQALATLPEREREVVLAYAGSRNREVTSRKLAAERDVAASTIRSRHRRGIARLEAELRCLGVEKLLFLQHPKGITIIEEANSALNGARSTEHGEPL